MADEEQLYHVTPTVRSGPMSRVSGCEVYLKLENLQAPASFKIRGVSNLCKKAVKGRNCQHLVCASGGNAGMAAAYAGMKLKTPATIVLPESTSAQVAENLRQLGAEVLVHGKVFDHANKFAIELASKPGAEYIHPFDHPDIWEGHESLIVEAAAQMPVKPDVVLTSVGGGGLLIGIVQGMWKVGWKDVPIIAMETDGANCFNAAIKAGELVTLPDITSVAKCLGSLTVSSRAFELHQKKEHNIQSVVIEDKEAVSACLRFADDHRMLVEPACGAALAAVYSNIIPALQQEGRLGKVETVLVVVCGGGSVSLDMLQAWKKQFDL
ncbi:serine dehydratase-like [Haliotis rufescens]|uniref:serine dehydratase-like n=1 Tax=Haliotis rufescens TaxID=6454 RepID=UPI00201F9327|nr:serine dehydratase-like [Haliotis rufescens]XP_046330552.2 serine dehydratase-like [Haliotis rufescens]